MNIGKFLSAINSKALAAPGLVIIMLSLMILPVPPFALDIFFSFNISISVIVLLTALYTVSPLDFMAFPAVLLLTTILRLSLNVASTRIVLTEGHNGPDAAGKVIEAFGHFLIGGNYLVGVVVFIILTIINFMVITKGAGRIAEVGARFALDAMPGKQMAIDADLNAGLIGEADARKRRKEVAQEAEFYGAMDGASKYVRGDAVAGIIIVIVNMVGGLVVGMIQHDLAFSEAIETYTMLAIGDGLVAQLPSLIISVAAGAVVSRVVSDEDVGTQLVTQLFMKAQVLYITAGIVGGLGMIPGMPHLAFLFLALLIGGTAYYFQNKPPVTADAEVEAAAVINPDMEEVTWQDVVPVQALCLEVGYRLVPLVDKNQNGDLFRRIRGVRRKFTQDMGFLPPGINIVDNLGLTPTGYRVTLKGVEIGKGESYPDQVLAINSGMITEDLPGRKVTDPSFGLPAVWVSTSLREKAQGMGYTVVDASTVVATHLSQLLMKYAAELLNRHALQALLDHMNTEAPGLVDELIPKVIPLPILQKILQNLLSEDIHIRDMHTIFETIAEYGPQTQDASLLTSMVRIALGRSILEQIIPGSQEIPVMALDNRLEQLLLQSMQSGNQDGGGIEPGLAETLVTQTVRKAQMQEDLGYPPILLVPAPLRTMLARFLHRTLPDLKVLSQAELPDTYTIKVTNFVGAAA
ncbi:MAG: flagellar biosynthesis protein FlhA [Methylococcales bacterium]|nr:MAG: flagellar biosynthesis protein FlhA [Methylococcales bacterium]